MSDLRVDVAVVGAGLMGAATASELTRRGVSVALLEQHDVGHASGSSHGSSRIFRRAYRDPFYVHLTGRARELWREAELDTGIALLRTTGALDHGPGRDPVGLHAVMLAHGVPCTLLPPEAAGERWPGLRFDGPVLLHPQAGVLDPDAAVAAWVQGTRRRGGEVLERTAVLGVDVVGDAVRVRTDGPTVLAGAVVVAAGAWLAEDPARFAVPELPALEVTQQQVVHLRQRDSAADWPAFVHKDALQVYGLPSGRDGGAAPAIKLGQHDGGTVTTATGRDGVVDPAARDRLRRYAEQWLPGLDPEPVAEATCLYTTTADEDFVLDRVGRVVVASPCSGHGAKFAPLVGVMATDLALGAAEPEARFRLRR